MDTHAHQYCQSNLDPPSCACFIHMQTMRTHVGTLTAELHDGSKSSQPPQPEIIRRHSPSCTLPILLGRRACLGATAMSLYISAQPFQSIAGTHIHNIKYTTTIIHPADRDPRVLVDALPEQDTRGLTSLQADMLTRGVPQNPGPSFAITKKQKQLFYPAWLQVGTAPHRKSRVSPRRATDWATTLTRARGAPRGVWWALHSHRAGSCCHQASRASPGVP